MTEDKFLYRCMFLSCFSAVVLSGGCARFKANRPNAVPLDPAQVQAAHTEAGFNDFLHDVTHVPGGRANPEF